MLLPYFLALFLAVSLALNGYQYRRHKLIKREPSADARLILGDLMRGVALVKVSRVAPEDVLLRTSRGGL